GSGKKGGGKLGTCREAVRSGLGVQLLDHFGEQRGVVLLNEMVDAVLRQAELLHGRGGRRPSALAFLALAQVQLAHQFRQTLAMVDVLVVIVTLEYFLLMGGEIGHRSLLATRGAQRFARSKA